MYSPFLKICEIVTFDLGYQLINETEREKTKNEIQKKFLNAEVKEVEFNSDFYDCEFIRINKNKRPIVINGVLESEDIKNILSSYQKDLSVDERDEYNSLEKFFNLNKLNFRVVLSCCGMGTLRVGFDLIQNNIDTINIIKSTGVSGVFVDEYVFPHYFKEKILESLSSVSKEKSEITLKEHLTYSIIATNNERNFSKNEIYGIVWRHKDYEKVKDKITDKVVNDIAIESSDNFIISQPGAFMRFLNTSFERPYFQNHVNALEILLRQFYLLKKFDFQLTEVIEKKGKENLSLLINRIIQIHDDVFLFLEFYKNIKIFGSQEFVYMFERGNDVFRINDLYESLNSKVDWSYNIVNNSIQEQRNNLINRIKILGFLFSSLAFVITALHPLLIQFFTTLELNPKIGFILRALLVPSLDLIISIFIAWFGIQLVEKDTWLKRKFLQSKFSRIFK